MPGDLLDEQGKIYNSPGSTRSGSIRGAANGKMCKVGGFEPLAVSRSRSFTMIQFTRTVVGAAVVAAGVTATPGCFPTAEPTGYEPPKFAEDAVPKVVAAAEVKFD